MQIVQATGPFTAGTPINFNYPAVASVFRYVKVGVQTPQAPPITEIENFNEMYRFGIGTDNSMTTNFYINANDVLEFDDFYTINQFKIIPLQDMDAYTIVEIGFSDIQETD